MLFQCESGILLHPTSLPGPYGIGDIGPAVIDWLDYLAEMKQTLWQVLPLGPTGFADSPYQCLSSFAANPLLVSLDTLMRDGLLEERDFRKYPDLPAHTVLYEKAIQPKMALLQKASQRFLLEASTEHLAEYAAFCENHAWWLDDYVLYATLKERLKLRPWIDWPLEYRHREEAALADFRKRLADAIEEHKVWQFFFHQQWRRVRHAAETRDIRIIGDIPIFVAHDSADVWSSRRHYQLAGDGRPAVIAGVPPDYFSKTGQRWGNPLYDWEEHAAEGYEWWIKRMRRSLELADIVRIDHFRGFTAYWEIPASEPTALKGRWKPGPGEKLFDALTDALGEKLPIIAEDLGVITNEVESLRDNYNLPGMRILQFAFGNDPMRDTFIPSAYIRNCVAYSGTHDNDTAMGWYHDNGTASSRSHEQCEVERQACRELLDIPGREINWEFIEVLLNSGAGAAIIPMQDLLGLGPQARMNRPGTENGNWRWRYAESQLTHAIRERMARLTEAAGRNASVAAVS